VVLQEGKPKRGWMEIAAEASRERNPARLITLIKELTAALARREEPLEERKTSKEVKDH
jgi:hypothetical protein